MASAVKRAVSTASILSVIFPAVVIAQAGLDLGLLRGKPKSATASRGTVQLCAAPSAYTRINKDSRCGSATVEAVNLIAMRGEVESGLLLLHSSNKLEHVNIESTELIRKDNSAHLPAPSAFQVGYIKAADDPRTNSPGGWFADALLPVPRHGMEVDAGSAQGVWLDIAVPRDTMPGVYQGRVKLTGEQVSVSGERQQAFSRDIPLQIQVSDRVLPQMQNSQIGTAWSGNWSIEYFKQRVGRYNAKTRRDFFNLMPKYRMHADAIYETEARSTEDVETLAAQGDNDFCILQVDAWIKKHKASYCFLEDVAVDSSACPEVLDALVKTLEPHVMKLEEKGMLDKAYVYGFDEAPQSAEPEIRNVFGAIKRAFPKLRTHTVINWELPADMPVDIWTVSYHLNGPEGPVDGSTWLKADPGRKLWWYHCVEPSKPEFLNNFLDRSPVQGRLLMWLAAGREAEVGYPSGWLYYKMDAYLLQKHDFVQPQTLNQIGGSAFVQYDPRHFVWFQDTKPDAPEHYWFLHDTFIYPSASGEPIPTIRLAALRDGLEDWELFKQLGKQSVGRTVKQLASSPRTWKDDPSKLEQLRAQVLLSK